MIKSKFIVYILPFNLYINLYSTLQENDINNYVEKAYSLANYYSESSDYPYINNLYIALKYFKKAYKLGHKQATYDINSVKIILAFYKNSNKNKINEENRKIITEAIKKYPENSLYWLAIAKYYYIKGDRFFAKESFKKAAELKNSIALFLLSEMLLESNSNQDIDLACDYLDQLISLYKNRIYEKRQVFLKLFAYREDELYRKNKNFRYLLGKAFLIFYNLILQKKFMLEKNLERKVLWNEQIMWQKDPYLYYKILALKKEFDKESIIGAL